MNKLKTDINGGFPLKLNDFRWWLAGNMDALKGLVSYLGDNLVLSGVELVSAGGTMFNYTEGYVILGGEIYKVEASAAPFDYAANPYLYMEPAISYDPAGLKTFENSINYDTYEVRNAVINAYSSAQAGKVAYSIGYNAEAVINGLIEGYSHTFTKRQSWAQATDEAIGLGQNYLPTFGTSGNNYVVDISDANTAIVRFNGSVPNGTWLAVTFTGTGVVKFTSSVLTNPIKTPGDKVYLFQTGETALFIKVTGAYYLVNGFKIEEPWHTVGSASEPAFNSGWSSPLSVKFRVNELGEVAIIGGASHSSYTTGTNNVVFTLPSGYRPSQKAVIRTYDALNDCSAIIQIETSGEVKYIPNDLLSGASVSVNFDGVGRFYNF